MRAQAAGKSTKVEITTVASNYHIEMNPSDVGTSDRLVVQEVLKEIAQYHLADTNSKRQFKGATSCRCGSVGLPSRLSHTHTLQSCCSWRSTA